MKKVSIKLSVLALVLGGFGNVLKGQSSTNNINVVTTAVPFLRISPDARSGGMGDVGIAISPDANSAFWNLAKTPFNTIPGGVSFTYTPWLKDIASDVYLAALVALGENTEKLQRVSDSALVLFPNDPDILARTKGISSTLAKSYFDSAIVVAHRKDNITAIRLFTRATELSPNDYPPFENIALTYYKMQDYVKALEWFDKVLAIGSTVDGKSYYFRGICLIKLSRKTEGCASLQEAVAKKFEGAEEAIKKNCK